MRARRVLVIAVVMLSAGACSDEHGHDHEGELPAECEAIRAACHRFDEGSGPAHDCHELAHSGDAARCAAEQDSCLDTCAPGDGG